MNKYEIMLILDPAADALQATQIVETAFGKTAVKKAEKLELSNLAYPINKSLKAQYMVYLVEGEASKVAEFTRRSNIAKFIWRQLVINLDSEKGFNKSKKVHKNILNKEARQTKSQGTKKLVEGIEKASKTRTVKKESTKKVDAE